MSYLIISKQKDGYQVDAAESGSPENGAYYARYRCIHRQPTKEDTPYDFYDCAALMYGKTIEIQSVSFNPKLFQIVEERREVS